MTKYLVAVFVLCVFVGVGLAQVAPTVPQTKQKAADFAQPTISIGETWKITSMPTQTLSLDPNGKALLTVSTVKKITFSDETDGDTLVCWKGSCKRLNEVWPSSRKWIEGLETAPLDTNLGRCKPMQNNPQVLECPASVGEEKR